MKFLNFKKNIILIGFSFGILFAIFYLLFVSFTQNKLNYNSDLTVYNSDMKNIKAEFKVSIADTYEKRKKGLMFVKNMPDNSGMLFVFDNPQQVSFWMKNTYISLDLLFVNENMRILHIFEKANPLSEKLISFTKPVKYVIELNAGVVSDYQIKLNDIIKISYKNEYETK